MKRSLKFLNSILDSITEHIVVIDKSGNILYVNQSWKDFAKNNNYDMSCEWESINYLKVCKDSAKKGDKFGITASIGIQSVIDGTKDSFYFEYPCHGPNEQRWFMMRVVSFLLEDEEYFIISHQNITERKMVEQEVCELARVDGLTSIPNRRTFDQFLHDTYRRYMRLEQPITLLMIDIDHFKILNDTYGHQVGDNCLIQVAKLLQSFANRADDLCARYGGEEFAIIWGGTTRTQSKEVVQKILQAVNDLQIPNENAPTKKHLTVSIGIAEIIPPRNSTELILINQADEKLYKAKRNGRNRIEF